MLNAGVFRAPFQKARKSLWEDFNQYFFNKLIRGFWNGIDTVVGLDPKGMQCLFWKGAPNNLPSQNVLGIKYRLLQPYPANILVHK